MSEPERELLRCAAALLDQGRTFDRLSRLLTAAALGWILVSPAIATEPRWAVIGFPALVALAGLGEMYFAIRIAFDRVLFDRVAGAREVSDFAATDEALLRLGLMTASKAGRPADVRIAGARRLFRFQIGALVVQASLIFASGFTVMFG
jgi:hypothetical protein